MNTPRANNTPRRKPQSSFRKDKLILAAKPWKYEQGYEELGGWLRKTTRKGQWKKRWFRLQASYLVYYKSPTSQKPLGFLDMSDISSVRRCFGPVRKKTPTELAAANASSSSSSSSPSPRPHSLSSSAPPHFQAQAKSLLKEMGENYLVLTTKQDFSIVLIVEPNKALGTEVSTAAWYKVLSITIAAVSGGVDRQTQWNTSEQGRWTHSWHVESVALCDEVVRTWVAGSENVNLNCLNTDVDESLATVAVLGTKLMRHPSRYSLTVHIEERTGVAGKRHLSGTAIFPTHGSCSSGMLLVPCRASFEREWEERGEEVRREENEEDEEDEEERAEEGEEEGGDEGEDEEEIKNLGFRLWAGESKAQNKHTKQAGVGSGCGLETDLVAEIYWRRIPVRDQSMVHLLCGLLCSKQEPKRWLQVHRPTLPALIRSMHPYATQGVLVGAMVFFGCILHWILGDIVVVVAVPYPRTIVCVVFAVLLVGLLRSKHRNTLLQCFDW